MIATGKLVLIAIALIVVLVGILIALPWISLPLCERAIRRVFEDRITSHWYYDVDCNQCDAASVINALPPITTVDCYDLWGFGLGNDWDCRVIFADGSKMELMSQWWGISHLVRFQGPPDGPPAKPTPES